jgi:membrane-bound lytic murein transglycosylase D
LQDVVLPILRIRSTGLIATIASAFVLAGCAGIPAQYQSLTSALQSAAGAPIERAEPAVDGMPAPGVDPQVTAPVQPAAQAARPPAASRPGFSLLRRAASPTPAASPSAAAAEAAPSAESTPVETVEAPLPDPPRHMDIWDRIRAGFTMPPLDTPLVEQKEKAYLANPEALQRMFVRGGRYLYFIVEELEKRQMPTELALLPFVESAMNPVALSPAKASGLWQFIPATGNRYELSQNWWVDNRRDVVKSTQAALEYLQTIHVMHERDWFLALASYNWGENAVARAVQRNRAAGQPAGYLDLRMPNETRNYVPKLIALKQILLRAGEHGFTLPPVPNEPYFATIEKTRPIDLKLAAQFAGMGVDEFVALNPAHNRPVIAASRNNLIKLPADRLETFLDAMQRHDASGRPLASWQPYTLQRGESLEQVAARGGATAAEVLEANGLKRGARILAGSRILVPQRTVADESKVESFQGPRVYEEVRQAEIRHVVRQRETLPAIARRYRVTVDHIQRLNTVPEPLVAGTRLLIQRASTQTVLTTESGAQRVIVRAADADGEGDGAAAPAVAARPPAAPRRTANPSPQPRQQSAQAPKRPVGTTQSSAADGAKDAKPVRTNTDGKAPPPAKPRT